MSSNLDIFDQLNDGSEGEDFYDLTAPQAETKFSEVSVAEPENQKDIFDTLNDQQLTQKSQEFGFLDTARDVGEQIATKGLSGLGGAYGNILEATGLQIQEGQKLPGQEARAAMQSDILDKLSRGEVPSLGEFMALSDDDILPEISRAPTSKEIQKQIEDQTGIGEGKTPAGRISGQGAQALGEGIATGSGIKSGLGLLASSSGAQGVREAGGPEGLATAIEIGGPLSLSAIERKLNPQTITKAGKETSKLVEGARKLGLAEEEITPLIQSQTKTATLAPIAKKSEKTKDLFAKIKQKLGDSYESIKNNPIAKNKLPRDQQIELRKRFGEIRNELEKTLAPSAEKQAAIDYIEKSLFKLREVDVTPEHLVNFWQDVNKTVDWNKIGGGKKALAQLKKPVADVLEKISPALAKDFDLTNQLYSKYAAISKKLKPDIVDAFLNKAEIMGYVPAALALTQGNPWGLIGLGSETAIRLLGREMIINPYFQNIGTKLVKNMNKGSVQGVKTAITQVKEYMQRKHPNETWDFLAEEITQ